jgi:uncharacterized OsmC-like protein
MSTTDVKLRNGVDIHRLAGTIRAVEADPSLAEFRFRAHNRWIDGGHNRSTIQGFYGAGQEDESRTGAFVYDNDEPDVLLGRDNGANPVEYILHALAGCLTTSIVYHAAARGIRIERVESWLEGDLDLQGFLGVSDDVRRGYDAIRVRFAIDAPGATREQLEELVQMGPRFSPVFDTVTNPVAVSVSLAE